MTMAADDIRQINLALQGGGSHGAFTWGVLDRLLEDGRLKFAAVSGTSAGAMNAVALADGWARGGSDGARERLHAFWRAVAIKGVSAQFSACRGTCSGAIGRWKTRPDSSGST
jgi:NTE family protein